MFIVFEGCDKSGKTTQALHLFKFLRKNKKKVYYISFPQRKTETGKILDKFLKKKKKLTLEAAHLLFSADKYQQQNKIKTLLKNNYIVICDRYSLSGIVYSLASGLEEEFCFSTEKNLIKPDITFFLEKNLINDFLQDSQSEIFEKKDFQEKVLFFYKKFEKSYICITFGEKKEVFKKILSVIKVFLVLN